MPRQDFLAQQHDGSPKPPAPPNLEATLQQLKLRLDAMEKTLRSMQTDRKSRSMKHARVLPDFSDVVVDPRADDIQCEPLGSIDCFREETRYEPPLQVISGVTQLSSVDKPGCLPTIEADFVSDFHIVNTAQPAFVDFSNGLNHKAVTFPLVQQDSVPVPIACVSSAATPCLPVLERPSIVPPMVLDSLIPAWSSAIPQRNVPPAMVAALLSFQSCIWLQTLVSSLAGTPDFWNAVRAPCLEFAHCSALEGG